MEYRFGLGFFDIREHHFPQDLDMRRVDSIFDDAIAVGVKITDSDVDVHFHSLPMTVSSTIRANNAVTRHRERAVD